MKGLGIFIKIALLVLFSMSCTNSSYNFSNKGVLSQVQIKKPESSTRVLSNGLTVVYKKSEDVPVFKASLYIPKGSSDGSCGISGLSDFSVSMMREGGTKSYSPDQLDRYLDNNAIQIESSQAEDFTSFSVSSLSEDTDEAIKIFNEILLYPRFDLSRIDLLKKLSLNEIIRRKDDAHTISNMIFSLAMYGEGSRWYNPTTSDTIKKISPEKIRSYYSFLMNPKGAYLIASSQLSDEDFFTTIEGLFTNWQARESINCSELELKDNKKIKKPTILVAPMQFEQASIILGHSSGSVGQVEFYKQALFNRVFGSGSFDSLLFREIRDKRGLAYSVSGGFFSMKKRGFFYVDLGTKASQATNALLSVKNVISEVKASGFSPDNIEGAVRSVLQTYVFRYEDPFYSISRPALISLSGYPDNYDDNYQSGMIELIGNNLKDFASKELLDDEIVVSIVGKVDINELKKSELAKDFVICEVSFKETPRVVSCH